MHIAKLSLCIQRAASRIARFGNFAIDLENRLIDAPKWSLAPEVLTLSVWRWVAETSGLSRTNACRVSFLREGVAEAHLGTSVSVRIA